MNTVLIADDAAFMRMAIRRILEEEGFTVVGEVENGEACVKKYIELRPDIVTLDITMPVMDGIQALKALKKINPDVKVIVISALGQESLVKEAVLNGVTSFIIKPFKKDHVVSVLNKVKEGS